MSPLVRRGAMTIAATVVLVYGERRGLPAPERNQPRLPAARTWRGSRTAAARFAAPRVGATIAGERGWHRLSGIVIPRRHRRAMAVVPARQRRQCHVIAAPAVLRAHACARPGHRRHRLSRIRRQRSAPPQRDRPLCRCARAVQLAAHREGCAVIAHHHLRAFPRGRSGHGARPALRGVGTHHRGAFTSVPDRGAEIYPWLPVHWLATQRFANIDKIGHVAMPKLLMHARDDSIIPYAHGQQLFEAASAPKQWVELSAGTCAPFSTTVRTSGGTWGVHPAPARGSSRRRVAAAQPR